MTRLDTSETTAPSKLVLQFFPFATYSNCIFKVNSSLSQTKPKESGQMQRLIHSSPPSSEMELSRNLQRPTQNSESSVQDIVTKYRKVKALNPIVSRICESTKNQDMLRKSLQHDLSLIRGRSSRLDDHEISITQKAYMLLMQNRDDRLGGIELYVQEIIGLQYVDATESLACLQTAMKTRDVFLHRMNPSPKNRRFVFYLREKKKKNPMN